MDADIAQGMVIERREFRQHPSIRGAGPGASPPQRQHQWDLIDDPRFAAVRGSPGYDFAAAKVRRRRGGPESARRFGALNFHSKISFRIYKAQTGHRASPRFIRGEVIGRTALRKRFSPGGIALRP
jgi:hypothetical protein